MKTALTIVVIVLIVGGWLALHAAMRRQRRRDREG
jgi:heme/copper-type cytochrome/quinol oxidase subunit 2